jgi:hypothetical protein
VLRARAMAGEMSGDEAETYIHHTQATADLDEIWPDPPGQISPRHRSQPKKNLCRGDMC